MMEEIRDIVSENLSVHQQHERESLLNRNRKIENVEIPQKVSREDVVNMANQLKKKKVTPEQFSKVKESLLQDKENINAFLEVDGALEALVTALSGQNAKLQINAAYCLCNLSLGEKYLKIIKVAGPYLLMHLEGMNSYLVEACTWTIGNLSSHSGQCVKLLNAQGALPSLAHLLKSDDHNIHIAAAYALSHFIYEGYDILTSSDFQHITESVVSIYKSKHHSLAYIMSLLSANANCQLRLLQAGVHIESLEYLLSCLKTDIRHSTWYLRIVANLIAEESGEAALKILNLGREPGNEHSSTLCAVVEYIVASGQIFLLKECSWLVGNLLNHKNSQVSKALTETNIIQIMAKPVRFFLSESTQNGHTK